jgi:hypothetical protein
MKESIQQKIQNKYRKQKIDECLLEYTVLLEAGAGKGAAAKKVGGGLLRDILIALGVDLAVGGFSGEKPPMTKGPSLTLSGAQSAVPRPQQNTTPRNPRSFATFKGEKLYN